MNIKRRMNPYDALTLTLVIFLVLTVISHILIPKNESVREIAQIEVKIDKMKYADEIPSIALADGRFSFDIVSVKNGVLHLSCQCFRHSAGIMSVGGKLLCPNQPIALSYNDFYAEGRILAVKLQASDL